jgi:hypothetical protein
MPFYVSIPLPGPFRWATASALTHHRQRLPGAASWL